MQIRVWRFLLDPTIASKVYSTQALRLFVAKVFSETPLTTLDLTDFDFNKTAIRCYQKVGFKTISEVVRPNDWIGIQMEIRRNG